MKKISLILISTFLLMSCSSGSIGNKSEDITDTEKQSFEFNEQPSSITNFSSDE